MCTEQLLHIADVCVYKISTENVNFVVLCSARVNARLLINYAKVDGQVCHLVYSADKHNFQM